MRCTVAGRVLALMVVVLTCACATSRVAEEASRGLKRPEVSQSAPENVRADVLRAVRARLRGAKEDVHAVLSGLPPVRAVLRRKFTPAVVAALLERQLGWRVEVARGLPTASAGGL